MTCSFTGHRPKKLISYTAGNGERYSALKETLKKEIIKKIENGADTFLSGMALGIDTIAARAVIELKKTYPYVKLVAVIPCEGQERLWKEKDVTEYADILSQCDEKVVLSEKYTSYCMHVRNKYLVDNSDSMIAVWDGSPGGTGGTVALARKKGVPVTVIDPATLAVEEPITFFS